MSSETLRLEEFDHLESLFQHFAQLFAKFSIVCCCSPIVSKIMTAFNQKTLWAAPLPVQHYKHILRYKPNLSVQCPLLVLVLYMVLYYSNHYANIPLLQYIAVAPLTFYSQCSWDSLQIKLSLLIKRGSLAEISFIKLLTTGSIQFELWRERMV